MQATLTSKGQITIPAGIRRRLGLKPGHVLEFDETVSYLKATRAMDADAWKKFGRKAVDPWPELTSAQVLEKMRGPVEIPPKSSRPRR